jgi:hypothetical protein
MFRHQEEEKDEEEQRSQSPIKKRRLETRRYPRILLDHEQVPHSLNLRNKAGVENIKSSSLEVHFTTVSVVFVSYVLFKLSCTRVYKLNRFTLNILIFT